jgi:hypothetical protein
VRRRALLLGTAGLACAGVRARGSAGVDAAAWMVGRWVDPEGGGEAWTRIDDVLLGVGWLRGAEGWNYEVMRIDAPARLRFTAWPSGQVVAHFPERARGAEHVEFAAPEHDFPKVVRYARRPGGLVARVEGDAPADGQDFNYVGVPEAPMPEVEAADRGLVAVGPGVVLWLGERRVEAERRVNGRTVVASGAAPGGELAYTLGRYADGAERGGYVFVWRRVEAGWRVEFAVLQPG